MFMYQPIVYRAVTSIRILMRICVRVHVYNINNCDQYTNKLIPFLYAHAGENVEYTYTLSTHLNAHTQTHTPAVLWVHTLH